MNKAATQSPEIDYQFLATALGAATPRNVYQTIVGAPFENGTDMVFLFLGFICLYIVDEETNEVRLVAVSGTDEYRRAVEHMNFKPEEYALSFDEHKDNTIVQAIASGKPKHTTDWATLNSGQTPVEAVRLNQANSGIAYTAVHPFTKPKRGALMYNYYQYRDEIGDAQEVFMKQYTKLAKSYLTN